MQPALQFLLSFLLIKIPLILNAFNSLSKGVLALKEATDKGTGLFLAIFAEGAPNNFGVMNSSICQYFHLLWIDVDYSCLSSFSYFLALEKFSIIIKRWLPFQKTAQCGRTAGGSNCKLIFGQVGHHY